MSESESVIGLGVHAGAYLLESLKLPSTDDQCAGPEFSYLGVFLSGLCFKSHALSATDLVSLCLEGFKGVHAQLGDSDAALANALAESAFSDYLVTISTWPSKGCFLAAGIQLCSVLTARLKQHHGITLSVMQQARLRPLIAEQFEILEVAHVEMRQAAERNSRVEHQVSVVNSRGEYVAEFPESTNNTVRLAEIDKARAKLRADWDDGEITTHEYSEELDKLIHQEIIIHVAEAEKRCQQQKGAWPRRKVIISLAGVFLVGFFTGSWLYPKIFGFRSAEECVIATKSKYTFDACYDLYPSIKKK